MANKVIKKHRREYTPPGESPTLRLYRAVLKDEETGAEEVRWMYGLPNVVQVIALTKEGKVIAISEFQPGVGEEYLHLIGETLERGETPLEAAKRGLLEESGYEAFSMELVSTILENSGFSDRAIYLVLATGCEKVAQGEKEIKVELLTPMEFLGKMMAYFFSSPEEKHGGGNSLKLMALAYWKLGLIDLKRGDI